jgi:hypothetical protein
VGHTDTAKNDHRGILFIHVCLLLATAAVAPQRSTAQTLYFLGINTGGEPRSDEPASRPLRPSTSLAQLLKRIHLAQSTAEADRIFQMALPQAASLEDFIELAKVVPTQDSMKKVVSGGIPLCKSMASCLELARALRGAPGAEPGWKDEVDRVVLAGVPFAASSADALKLQEQALTDKCRIAILKKGGGLATNIDDVATLVAKAPAPENQAEIVASGIQVAEKMADVERLMNLVADQSHRDLVLKAYAEARKNPSLAEMIQLIKLTQTRAGFDAIVDRAIPLLTSLEHLFQLAEAAKSSVPYKFPDLTLDRIHRAGLPLCKTVGAAVKMFWLSLLTETRNKFSLKAVDLAGSIADVETIVSQISYPEYIRMVAVEGARLARSLEDVYRLQKLVKDTETKTAILRKYLDTIAPR